MTKTMKVCIIEDDEDARDSLKDILLLDYDYVISFASAREAMDEGLTGVDVVLMDRKLPDGLAEELLPEMKRLAADTDFIVITGYADLHAAIAAMREGVSDYLIKPIDPDALRLTLARLARKRSMERELYRQRRFAEMVLETAEAIVLVLDTHGRVLRANPYLLELTQYSMSEVVGQDWFSKFIPAQDRQAIWRVFEKTVDQVATRGVVNPILTRTGQQLHIRWSNSTLRDVHGATTAVLCVGLDVSDVVQTQKQLLQHERLAAIGQTVAGLAHESRNALQRLQNAIELLQEELVGQPQALKDLEKIERAGNHIRNLLEEVRGYAAPINLSLSSESLATVWRRAWQSLTHRLQRCNATFQEVIPEGNSCRAPIDAVRMEQVFRNLFENALDASDGVVSIRVHCHTRPDAIEVVIEDDGPGVPEGYRNRLFDAFVSTKSSGTGLGLAICHRVVEAHGGQLTLLDNGPGARFSIRLPRGTADRGQGTGDRNVARSPFLTAEDAEYAERE